MSPYGNIDSHAFAVKYLVNILVPSSEYTSLLYAFIFFWQFGVKTKYLQRNDLGFLVLCLLQNNILILFRVIRS